MKDGIILGIETSCDETAAAVVVNGRETLSNVISSQIDIHTEYGGVVPEIASRKHIERISQVVGEAIKESGVGKDKISAVAVTYGPGLVGPLLIGVSYAKAFSYGLGIPLIGVNHILGHVSANYIENKKLTPPFLCLVVSGGHTHLIRIEGYYKYEVLGRTMDDAAGEAFDKVARAIGLGYPGGPKIDEVAKKGNDRAVEFPIGHGKGEFDFSFSGLKSAVLNYLNSKKMAGETIVVPDIAASFQRAVVEALTQKAVKAIEIFGDRKFAIAGGVASNSALRESLKNACRELDTEFYLPSPVLCTDNAAMIAAAAYYDYIRGKKAPLSLNAVPDLKL